MMEDALTCLGCVVYIVLIIAISFFNAWCLEWAWNISVPALFHGPHIDFVVAYAIGIVLSLLAGLFRFQGKS